MTAVDPRLASALSPTADAGPGPGGGTVAVVSVPLADLPAVVSHLAGDGGARLADVFASAADGGADGTAGAGSRPVTLRLVWGVDASGRYLITESVVDGDEYPPLSGLAPAAFYEECEMYEQHGIRPTGGEPLNRVVVPPHNGAGLPRLGRAPAAGEAEAHAPHVVGGGHAFEYPFGPVRQAGMESLYYGLVTSGEEIVDLYMFTWHKHRGAEWRAQGMTPGQALFHIERVEGLGAVSGGWAFAAAAEMALGITPPTGAARTRAVALELERLYNHAAATAALCQATGLAVGQAAAEIALERLLRVNAAAFGHRYLFGVIDIGGTRRGPDTGALRRELPGAYGELKRAADALLGTNSFLDRLEATGILTAATAHRLGLVGPVARACGLTGDSRADHPVEPYSAHPATVATGEGGDALARFRVMLAEAEDSVRLINGLLDAGAGPGQAPPEGGPASGWGLGWAESSRGEALAYVALDRDGRVSRARLRPASARNWRAFDDACRSQNVFTDVPIIEASFWLTVAGISR